MSIEKLIQDLQASVEANSKALSALTMKLDEVVLKTPKAVAEDTAASKTATTNKTKDKSEAGEKAEVDIPVYWVDRDTGEMGECKNEAEWVKVKKAHKAAYKVPGNKYRKMLEDKENESDEGTEEESTGLDTPEVDVEGKTEEQMIKVMSKYLDKTLDKEERDARVDFVRPLLQRFGVNRATELKKDSERGLLVALVEAKMNGHDFDPNEAPWDPMKILAEAAGGSESDEDEDLV